jgi:hypothetical protein
MKKIFTTLLVAAMTLTAFASGEFTICGVTITKDVIDAGIVDSLNRLPNTTVSGSIDYDSVNHVLTFGYVSLKSNVSPIITLTDSANVEGKEVIFRVYGSATLETTSSWYSRIILTEGAHTNSRLRILGVNRGSMLILKGTADYAMFLPTTVSIENMIVDVEKGKVGTNGKSGVLTLDRTNLEIHDEDSWAFGGLYGLTLKKCTLVEPEGAEVTDSFNGNSGSYGVNRPDGNTDPIVFMREPEYGDTIRYTYKGQTWVYKITSVDGHEAELVHEGSLDYYWHWTSTEHDPIGAFVVPDSVEDWFGNKYAVTTMCMSAFNDCDQLTSIDFSDNKHITLIPRAAFRNCTALQEVIFSDVVEELYDYAFDNCPLLTSIDFKKIKIIGPWTFLGSNIEWVHIPASVTQISSQTGLFDHAIGMSCEPGGHFVAMRGCLFTSDVTKLISLPFGLGADAEIHIPSTVTSAIYGSMSDFKGTLYINSKIDFEYHDSRNSPSGDVVLGCGLTEYYTTGNYAGTEGEFASVQSMTEQLQWNVYAVSTTQGTVAITDTTDCNAVTVTLSDVPEGYTFVNWNNGSTELTTTCEVTSDTLILANVKKNIGVGDTFTANTVEGVSVTYKVLTKEAGNMTVQVGDYSTGTRPNAIDKYTSGVVTIPDSAVYFDEKFEVVRVAQYAFWTCNSVTALHLPNTITKIDALGVDELTGVKEVNIPNKLENLGRYNFAYLYELKSITIPSSVKYIEYGVFSFNNKLEEIVDWNPSNIERMGRIQWASSSPIRSNSDYFQEEHGYRYMGDIAIDLPNSQDIEVKEGTRIVVGGSAIPACKNISIPSTVEALSSGVIYQCALLETCTIKAVTPPVVYNAYEVETEEDASWLRAYTSSSLKQYGNTPTPEDVKYFVPKAGIATYKADEKWNMLDLRPIEGWTVSFRDHNGNNIIQPQQVQQGSRPAIIPTEVEPYYTYDFMYIFANAWDTTVVNLGDTIYTARYTPQDLPIYKVYFHETQEDAEAQTTNVGFTKVQHGHAVEEDVLAAQVAAIEPRECEEITDWAGGNIENVTSEQHVYPIWGDGFYDITFFDPLANAPIVVRENVECGEIVVAPEAPKHEGKRFEGWDDLTWQTTRRYKGDLTVNAIYVDEGQGIESVESKVESRKTIRDGVLYIERNGKTYNAQGGLVE